MRGVPAVRSGGETGGGRHRGETAARFTVAKGAPQVIVDLCKPDAAERKAIDALVDRDAAKGYRTLGRRPRRRAGNWRFLGLLPLFDPPRDDSAATIAATRAMGVDVKMVTGDHEAIAAEIAGKLGLGRKIVVAGGRLRRRTPPIRTPPASSPPTASPGSSPSTSSRSSRSCRAPATSSA